MPARILAIVSRPDAAHPILAAAALLAGRLGNARMEVLHVRHDAMADFMPTEEVMTGERRQETEAASAGRSAAVRSAFDAWMLKDGAASGAQWRERVGKTSAVIAEEATKADIVVLG